MSRKLGVKCSTSNCGSKPPGNKRNDRISQTPSRNKKNKVEAQPRKVNKVNRIVKLVCDVDVMHSLSKANSKILYATCYPDCTLVSGLRMLETHDRESLSAHELYNGTEFVNHTLREWYENVGITHQTSLACTPHQNGVVERRNGTLVEVTRYFLKLHYFSGPKLSIQLVTPKTVL
ncbi:retrovirus-related pol polyprotein from transposon TNT 1-94 [Tanacetum coccineum]|uniref:Retrovirus-related pol polyprotein from transposon TNT 1-94 n=1 Tax=Tanacetum coccineum TaxID=301880 RepID=A0ABQ4WEZ2_9ASTR